MYSKTCILCQRTSLKRWFGNRTMTSNCDVTNSAQQIQMTTLCHWMKSPHENFLRTPLHGTFTRASPPVLTKKGWYCFVTNKTIKIFLSQNKFIEAWQRQTPRIFNWLTNIFRVKMRRISKPVVFNLFRAATHFATQFNLTTPFRKFPVRHMKCSCVCTIENHNDYKLT